MTSTDSTVFIYPYFDGEGAVQIDLYTDLGEEEPDGSATFDLDGLADEFIDAYGDEQGFITGLEETERAYAMIEALREAANKIASVVDIGA